MVADEGAESVQVEADMGYRVVVVVVAVVVASRVWMGKAEAIRVYKQNRTRDNCGRLK